MSVKTETAAQQLTVVNPGNRTYISWATSILNLRTTDAIEQLIPIHLR